MAAAATASVEALTLLQRLDVVWPRHRRGREEEWRERYAEHIRQQARGSISAALHSPAAPLLPLLSVALGVRQWSRG